MPLECNRYNMTRFVEVLESGAYVQGTGTLRKADDSYCCLGVACDISGQGEWLRSGSVEGKGVWKYVTQEGYSSSDLPKKVVDWFGLKGGADYFWDLASLPLPGEGQFMTGVRMNDSQNASFADIAKAIRRDYLGEEPAPEPEPEPEPEEPFVPAECNRDRMLQFAEVLESGRYTQGQHVLRNAADEYCCLGVACDISGRGEWMRAEDGHNWTYVAQEHASAYTMPKAVAEWLGLDVEGKTPDPLALPLGTEESCRCNEPDCGFGDNQRYGTTENDGGKTFLEIAAMIRKNYGLGEREVQAEHEPALD